MNKKQKIIIVVFSVLVLLATLFIFSNSLKSREDSGADSSAIVRLVEPVFDAVFGEDHQIDVHLIVRKAGHLTEFCILAVLVLNLGFALKKIFDIRLFGYCLFYVLLIAVFDEFIQIFSGRGSTVSDVLIDFCGAIIGFLITYGVHYIRKRSKDKNEKFS